jgi:hypothetical protein
MSSIKAFNDWHNEIPTRCDICGEKITDTFIDGKVHNASWAIMCPKCFERVGSGLGIGKGQVYLKGTKSEILYEGTDYDSSVKEVNEDES